MKKMLSEQLREIEDRKLPFQEELKEIVITALRHAMQEDPTWDVCPVCDKKRSDS